ncbi:hypothetical protein DFJ73DRAFT_565973 [Zopfochytrium polystomum]|nr:hypothetical protein DFJ73DRAFT_565973 [Zopfochytrium polystomum]
MGEGEAGERKRSLLVFFSVLALLFFPLFCFFLVASLSASIPPVSAYPSLPCPSPPHSLPPALLPFSFIPPFPFLSLDNKHTSMGSVSPSTVRFLLFLSLSVIFVSVRSPCFDLPCA